MNNTSFEPKTIEENFKINFAEYIDVFLNFQSTFLSNLNIRYKNLEKTEKNEKDFILISHCLQK